MTSTAANNARTGPGVRRRWIRAVVAVACLTAITPVIGVWYFSGRIRSDVLQVRPWKPPNNLKVVEAPTDPVDGTITLADAADPEPDLRDDGTFGLSYDGGFGLISGERSGSGAEITGDFALVSGESPRVGQRVTITASAYLTEPVPAPREVTYPGELGENSAVFRPGTSTTWAILVHGRGATESEPYRIMESTVALGMPSLSIRYRNDIGEPPDPSGYYGFGATEWRDLEAAVAYAIGQGAESVVLGGHSMGGAIVAAYLRNAKETDLVRAVVLDSPMLDLARTVEWGAEQLDLPWGLTVPAPVTRGARRLAGLRYGVDWSEVDYNDDTDWVRVPTLIMHGDADTQVPIDVSRDLAERAENATLVEVPAADHVRGWNADPRAYNDRVRGFLRKVAAG
ncbi:MAG: alpha/beta hydrolase family protein [Nocardioides sp.]